MNKHLNLFYHSPKELTTDGFLSWLFYFLDNEVNYLYKQRFFEDLILKPDDKEKKVSQISVSRQEKTKNGRCDLLVKFYLEDKEKTILFENKTRTTTTDKQLSGYKKDHPDLYEYFYLKLGYIFYQERKLAEDCGYKIIDVKKLVDTLKPLAPLNMIIEHYFDFIKKEYHDLIQSFEIELIQKNNVSLLNDVQAQQFFFSRLQEKMVGEYDSFYYVSGANKSGTPWSYLNFLEYPDVYGCIPESIFWRMDKRRGQYYLRLNLYSRIKGTGAENIQNKNLRLQHLRKMAEDIAKGYPDLTLGSTRNVGHNEQEIIIFFLDQNRLENLLKDIPNFSRDLKGVFERKAASLEETLL